MKIVVFVGLFLILTPGLVSCDRSGSGSAYMKIVEERCFEDRAKCSDSCKEKTFRYCYYYPTKLEGREFEIRRDCLGMHVGRLCSPCEDLYTLNFGGALQKVSCEAFYESLYIRDKKCNNCIKKGEFPE